MVAGEWRRSSCWRAPPHLPPLTSFRANQQQQYHHHHPPFFLALVCIFLRKSIATVSLWSQTIFPSLLLLKNMICCFAETPISQTHAHLASFSPASDLSFFFRLDWFWAFFEHRLMSSTFPASPQEVVISFLFFFFRLMKTSQVGSFNITTSGQKHTTKLPWRQPHIKCFFQGNWYLQQYHWCKTSRKRYK